MQRGLPCILLSPRGSCRPPGHSEDMVLQGPEALVDSSLDNAKAVSGTATVFAFLALPIAQCLLVSAGGLEFVSPKEAPYFILT